MTVFIFNCKDFFDKDALLSFQQTFYELVVYVNENYSRLLNDYQLQSGTIKVNLDLYVENDVAYP